MYRVQGSVDRASQTIRKLEEQSAQISEISALIGDIAARTNLLALNAAIEAARAGEHGKGFAVVAGEVRKLATQSDESSQGIIELIASIQQDTISAAETMKKSLAEVQEGVLAVEHAEQAFKEIVVSTGEVSSRVQEAAAAAEQLAASSEEVAASIANMGNIARQTAGMSQQVAASTEEQLASSEEMTRSSQMLSGIAKDLQTIVRKFTV
jgi:methyl-accepting chemotaxis protein